MKLRTTLMIAALAFGCSKKKDDNKAPDPTPKPNEPSKPDPAKPDPNAAKPDPNKPDPNAKPAKLEGDALAKKYLACVDMVNASKLDEFKKDCIAADYKGHMADGPDIPGPDGVLGFFKAMKTGFPDWKLAPQLVVISGRTIYGVNLVTGTNTADWKSPDGKDQKKTDKKIGHLMFHKLAINDENKAGEEWAFSDPMTMAGQLGQLPKEAGPSRPALDKGWEGAPVIVITKDDETEKKNIAAFNKAAEAFNSHKADAAAAAFTDDGLESDQASPTDAKGKKALTESAKFFITAFPDVKAEFQSVAAAGDWVVGIGTATGTHKGPLGPIKATNKPVTIQFAEIAKLNKDGKMTELWRFRNGAAMAAQLGLMPDPAKAGDAPKGDAPKGDPKGATPPKKDDKKAGGAKGGGW